MTIDFNKLVDKFNKANPGPLTEEELLELFKHYYNYIKAEIESGELKQIRVKYFGTFRPMMGKLKHLKYNINWDKFNPREKERYIKLIETYDKLAKEIEEEPKINDRLSGGEL